jgi:hypothetical protein
MKINISKVPLVEQVNSYLPGDSANQHPLRQAIRQVLREQARTRIVPLIALSLAGFVSSALGQQAVVELSGLDGSNGFVFDDLIAGDYSGFSGQLGIPVSAAGDINDDGIDDFLVGAPFSSPNGSQSGASYVCLVPVKLAQAARWRSPILMAVTALLSTVWLVVISREMA